MSMAHPLDRMRTTARLLTELASVDTTTDAEVLANLRVGHTEAVGEREAARGRCLPAEFAEALATQQAYRWAIRRLIGRMLRDEDRGLPFRSS